AFPRRAGAPAASAGSPVPRTRHRGRQPTAPPPSPSRQRATAPRQRARASFRSGWRPAPPRMCGQPRASASARAAQARARADGRRLPAPRTGLRRAVAVGRPSAEDADGPEEWLASLLRDLAGVPDARARALTGAAQPRRTDARPERLADRWSLPDWLEVHLIAELGEAAEAFCAAIAVPGPVCLRANRLLCTREQLAAHLFDEGIKTAPAPRAPDALFVRTPRANLFGARAWREGLFEPQDEGS